jgi:endoglucanase
MRIAALATAAALAGLLAPAAAAQDVRFDADPAHTNAARQAKTFARAGRRRDAARMRALSLVPQARWFNGGTPKQVRRDVDALVTAATGRQAVPVLVAYNVPNRDCSQYSAGGARNRRGYRAWIDAFARGIGDRRAVVIVEPDALAGLCGKGRLGDLRAAVDRLARGQTSVYVDAGHSNWKPAGVMARRLRKVHVRRAAGFALNVSNFRRTDEIVAYGTRISSALGGARFVIDTSRNGRGPWHAPRGREDWCNPPGRGLGARPTTVTGNPLVAAFLWVKAPGESDGQCAGGHDPPPGTWWPRYALGLIRRARPPLSSSVRMTTRAIGDRRPQ